MTPEEIKARARCCISGKPMDTSENINLIQLPYRANWAFPKWGNLISGQDDMAMALCHDDCINDQGVIIGEVKEAIEFEAGEVLYHPVAYLQREEIIPVNDEAESLAEAMMRQLYSDEEPQRCRVCGCTNETACHHPDYGNCWWAEPALCSHCHLVPGEATRHPGALRWEAEKSEQG